MSENNPADPKGRKQTPTSGSAASPAGTTAGAGTTGAQTSSHSEGMREELNQTSSKVKSEARETAREFTDSARASVQAQAERQQHVAAGELDGLARALRKTADEVQGQTSYLPLDRFARQAADKLDELSRSLQGSDVRTMLGRLESYTRDQPGVVLGGAIISGFLLARFMRASSEREHTQGYDSDRAVH